MTTTTLDEAENARRITNLVYPIAQAAASGTTLTQEEANGVQYSAKTFSLDTLFKVFDELLNDTASPARAVELSARMVLIRANEVVEQWLITADQATLNEVAHNKDSALAGVAAIRLRKAGATSEMKTNA